MSKQWLNSIRIFVCGLFVLLAMGPARADDVEPSGLWAAVAEGKAVAMMRHALAPGGGDPANFEIGNCATQRNLSDEAGNKRGQLVQRFAQMALIGRRC